jgi:hypothetical protein
MNSLEDRIRDAYQAAGRTVQPQTLQRTAPRVAAGSARRPRRLNALIPVAAAVAVLAVIGASVALPRLLTGSASPASTAGRPGISAHYPPFQVIVTRAGTGTHLLVRTPAGHVDSTLAPPRGTTWGDVTATANPLKFIVATSPNTRTNWNPFRLYTLTLSARGAVTHLTPLAVGSVQIQLGSLAADADGGVIAFSGERSSGAFVVGVVIGNQVKQWSVSDGEAFIGNVSVTSAGNKIAFITQYDGPGSHFAAMVLATGSAPGALLTRAKTVGSYDYPRKDLYMFSAAISPDGNWVYVVTRPILPSLGAKLPTTLTAYSTSRQGAPVTIATWTGGEPALLPIGGMLFAWLYAMPSSASAPSPASTAHLINPATRTKTAVRLPGVPSGQYSWLAWRPGRADRPRQGN